MGEMLALSIGVGLIVGLLFTELFGIASGGLVVPGYLALHLTEPSHLVATVGLAFIAFGIVRLLSLFMIIYGRRRTGLMILIGYLLGMLLREVIFPMLKTPGAPEIVEIMSTIKASSSAVETADFLSAADVIGFIIPGLIAVWMDRQGVMQTIASMLTVSIIVRLVLILLGVEVGQ